MEIIGNRRRNSRCTRDITRVFPPRETPAKRSFAKNYEKECNLEGKNKESEIVEYLR